MSEMTDKCAHAMCHCPARMDSDYCCEHCEFAEDDTETGCQCGHPECRLMQASAALLQLHCQYHQPETES